MATQELNFLNGNNKIDRFDPSTGTCYGKNYKTAIYGFFSQFQDSYFYSNFIQFIIVVLMYLNIGNGKYWKVLFYSSIAGLVGALIENSTLGYICQESQINKTYKIVPFFISEFFWIVCEYSIPMLNLIKMKAFGKGKVANIINYIVLGMFIPFAFCRFKIGYERMELGYLHNRNIRKLHGYAFFTIAVADMICTFSILYFVKLHNQQTFATSNVSDYIKKSSYIILITVDVVSFALSFLNILTNSGVAESIVPSSIIVPFHCFKSTFLLILAVDALLFKYGINVTSMNASSSGNNYKDPSSSNNDYSYNLSVNNPKSLTSKYKAHLMEMNNFDTKPILNNGGFKSFSQNANIANLANPGFRGLVSSSSMNFNYASASYGSTQNISAIYDSSQSISSMYNPTHNNPGAAKSNLKFTTTTTATTSAENSPDSDTTQYDYLNQV